MTVSIEIVPYADTVEMHGEADRNAAYSISGHVSISLSSSAFLFDRRRAHHLLLRSLVITFEGQSELVSVETGYSAVRLCSVTQELVQGEPVELSNEGQEDSDKPTTWNAVFNITIPGWLPSTSEFGDTDSGNVGTRYGLYATARFEDMDEKLDRSWWSALCNPLRPATRAQKARSYPIVLSRYVKPSTSFASTSANSRLQSEPSYPLASYHIAAQSPKCTDGSTPSIPPEVLSKLRMIASVPECIGMNEETFDFSLRLRTIDLEERHCKRLRLENFDVEVKQTERYRTQPGSLFIERFPLPPSSEQPPNIPLLNPNPVKSLFDLGLTYPQTTRNLIRTFPLAPEDAPWRYHVSGDGYVFKEDAAEARSLPRSQATSLTWFHMNTDVAFGTTAGDPHHSDWKARCRIRPSGQSPLFAVSHRMHVTLNCSYDLTEGENPRRASEKLTFEVPLRFVSAPPAKPSSSRSSSPASSSRSPWSSTLTLFSTSSTLPTPSLPYAQTLPAYSQLFDFNGDRKIDYSVPLPLYTPCPVGDVKIDPSSVSFPYSNYS